jgi:hypothetical protein
MANYDLTSNASSAFDPAYQIYYDHTKPVVVRHAFDIAEDMVAHSAADYVKLITIPKNTWISKVALNVHTAATVSSSTVNVGDSGSATRYISAADVTTTGFQAAISTTTPLEYFYTAADYLKVTLGSTPPTSGILSVTLEMTTLPDYAAL